MPPLIVSDVSLHCINEAAIEFNLPAKLIISILNTEQGKTGKISKNPNGSYDIGPMQINSSWLPRLKHYGISEHDIKYDSCLNVKIGTWILAQSIAGENNLLKGIGNYNSHTPLHNYQYSQKIRVNFTKISSILNNGD